MAFLLGIDTGGTFTDAAILDEDGERVVAKAKAPTTHGDLLMGVRSAMQAATLQLDTAGDIALVSVSTTLATNALVEGTGEPACLITLGFTDAELAKAGIDDVGEDCILRSLEGGHNAHGGALADLDLGAAGDVLAELGDRVSGFAVASQFSVRNPAHELALRDFITERTGKPVTCSHELSAQLGGPRRALTALLNARLVGMIAHLVSAVQQAMSELQIDAPLMIVRGNGTLVSAEFAAKRPIETVLSGPAASVIGAQHLATIDDGLVIDIGGTTTDIAVVADGTANTTTTGALVAGHRTMVEAVDMVTIGLGGDSEVRIDSRAAEGPIVVGPQRAIPLGRLALDHHDLVVETLERQLREAPRQATDARLLVPVVSAGDHDARLDGLDKREAAILGALKGSPQPIATVASTGLQLNAIERLRSRGLVRIATFTPTDAIEVLRPADQPRPEAERQAALLGARVLARQSRSNGSLVAANAEELAEQVVDRLIEKASSVVLGVALTADELTGDGSAHNDLAQSPLAVAGLAGHRGLVSVDVSLQAPIVAIGAPAHAYLPQVGAVVAGRNGTGAVTVPEHADVSNAIGSVVGKVRMVREATVSQPTKGQFRVHLDDQVAYGSVERAHDAALARLTELVTGDALEAGATDPSINHEWTEVRATVEGKDTFVDGRLVVVATGRPQISG